MKSDGLTEQVVRFSRFLKNSGFRMFSSNVVETLRGLEEIDISDREDFIAVLRANLTSNDMEWNLFRDLFEAFWQDSEEEGAGGGGKEEREEADCLGDAAGEAVGDAAAGQAVVQEGYAEKESLEGTTYSPVAIFEKKDLSLFRSEDIQVAQLILKNMMALFRITLSRRLRKSKRAGNIDFPRTMKNSIRTGGIPLTLFFKEKKKRLKKLVILADVSGSMDRYARFVMPFILGLKGVGPRAEVFVFSTSLTPVTSYLRRFDMDKALEIIAREVPDWSGGTRIGYSLQQFNEGRGERLHKDRPVVIIMSDGWDLGARKLLKREMEILQKRSHAVLWLNPLAVDSESCHISKGMMEALPYVDFFLPANSLEGLKRVGRTLCQVMTR